MLELVLILGVLLPADRDRAPTYYENILVPKHEILSDNEAKKALEELKTIADRLPRIFVADPALAGKGKKGQIVKIIREDVPGKKYVYYRVIAD